MKAFLAVLAATILAACGGSEGGGGVVGSATMTGAAGGLSLYSVVEAISTTYSGSCGTTTQASLLFIVLASTGGHCAQSQVGNGYPAGNVLQLEIANTGAGTQAAIAPGTYPVMATASAASGGAIANVDASGCTTKSFLAGSGSIVISSVSAAGVVGSYNLTFVDANNNPNGTLSGSFSTVNCAIDAATFCATQQNHC